MRDAPKKKKTKDHSQDENFVSYFVHHCLSKYFKSKKHMANALGVRYSTVLEITNKPENFKGASLVFQELIIYCANNYISVDEIARECIVKRVRGTANGDFEPKIIGKYSRNADGMEDKALGLYAAGMSQKDISEQIKALYGVEISPELVSKISERIIPQIVEWQGRPLDEVYPFVFMDAVHYKVREDGRIITKTAYVVLGINMDRHKEILGIWIGENETSKFWLSVMNDLKSRGVKMVYLFCMDGLNGFREAINAAFPKAGIQRCIIHQIRSSTRFVGWKELKAFVADLKKIYGSATEEEAFAHLMELKETWAKSIPLQ